MKDSKERPRTCHACGETLWMPGWFWQMFRDDCKPIHTGCGGRFAATVSRTGKA